MKKLLLTIAMLVPFAANAGVTVYYSPTCPHCHNALTFFETEKITVNKINVGEGDNYEQFRAALTKCEFESGGVPVIVIDGKCWQGYAPMMDEELRTAAANSTPDDAQKKTEAAGESSIYFYAILAALILGLGFVLLRKKKK